jgi:hypothetical protein
MGVVVGSYQFRMKRLVARREWPYKGKDDDGITGRMNGEEGSAMRLPAVDLILTFQITDVIALHTG